MVIITVFITSLKGFLEKSPKSIKKYHRIKKNGMFKKK